MQKNSIVKNYDLSLSIPKGDFQSMLAIQTLPTGKSFFPASSITDKYLSYNITNNDDFSVGVSYLPEIGSFQTDNSDSDENLESNIEFNFNKTKLDGIDVDENER